MKKTIRSIKSAGIRFVKALVYCLIVLDPVVSLSVATGFVLLSKSLVKVGIDPIIFATIVAYQIIFQVMAMGFYTFNPIKNSVYSIGYRLLTENSKELTKDLTKENYDKARDLLRITEKVTVERYGYSSSLITHQDGTEDIIPVKSTFIIGESYVTYNIALVDGDIILKPGSYRFIKSGSIPFVEAIDSDVFSESVAKELGLIDTYGVKPKFVRNALLIRHLIRLAKKIAKTLIDFFTSEGASSIKDEGTEKLLSVLDQPEDMFKGSFLLSDEDLGLKKYADVHFYAVAGLLLFGVVFTPFVLYGKSGVMRTMDLGTSEFIPMVLLTSMLYLYLLDSFIKQLKPILAKLKKKRIFKLISSKYKNNKESKQNKSTAEKI